MENGDIMGGEVAYGGSWCAADLDLLFCFTIRSFDTPFFSLRCGMETLCLDRWMQILKEYGLDGMDMGLG